MISSTFWKKKHGWQHILEKKTWLAAHSGKTHGWQHIWGKNHDRQHILGKKNLIDSTFWENMIGSTFWGKHD
jgi:hypothetical protein